MTSEILFIAFGEWVLGPVLCKISVYLEVVTLAAATFLLTAMSIDRYQVIVKPLESLTNRPKIWTKVTLAWCLAFIFAIPQTLIFRQVTEFDEKDGRHKHACKSKGYKDEWQRKLYFTFFTCYILIIPTIIMTFCYLKIMKVIWSRSETGSHGGIEKCNGKNPVSPRMSVNRNLVSSSRRKVVILTLTVIIGFLVCLTPYFVVSLVRIYSTYRIKLKDYLPATEMIFMLHSALNPILFGIFTFRLEHISCLVPKKCKSCFFNGLKDGVVDTPTSQWNDRNDVKLRLMASAKKHHHSIQSSTPQNALSCDLIRGKTENSLVCGESGKPLLYKPALKSALMIDRRENGNITLHVKAPSDPGTVDKSQRAAKNNYPPDYRSLFTQDRNLLTSEDYLKTGQGSAINTGHTCNDASREVKEYVSCV
ncbi:mesotocin receptor-like [Liolophura sinensis]|uniref:mesotocin receptor-like n=1 Tax=Liolophura sinensis TaxID=3198878 RepID=UPI0031593BDE